MLFIQVSGMIPGLIRKNSCPGDWIGGLALTGDIAGLAAIEITGAAALNFTVNWNAALGLAVIGVGAPVDFEAFAPAGLPPQLDFSLRYVFTDGTRLAEADTWHVTVVDQNDTPPSGIHFATGGSVVAGAIGSIIGTLAVSDPDLVGSFSYSFAEDDAWRFEVVGTTLKLKDGISLGLDDMPHRPVFINVSDGRQSAAFALDITVRDPAAQEDAVSTVTPDTPQSGFVQTTPQQVVTLHEARDLAAANAYDGDVRQILLADGLARYGCHRSSSISGWPMVGWITTRPVMRCGRRRCMRPSPGRRRPAPTLPIWSARRRRGWAGWNWPRRCCRRRPTGPAMRIWSPRSTPRPCCGPRIRRSWRCNWAGWPPASPARRSPPIWRARPRPWAAHAGTDGIWVSQPLGGGTAWHMDTGGLPRACPSSAARRSGRPGCYSRGQGAGVQLCFRLRSVKLLRVWRTPGRRYNFSRSRRS